MAPDLIRRRRALREGAAVGLGSQSLDKYGPESDVDWSDVSLLLHRWTNGWQPSKTIVTDG